MGTILCQTDMGRIYSRIGKKGKRIWFTDYTSLGRRYRKKNGPSKKLAQLALAEIELQIARGELNLSKPEISLNKLLREFDDFSRVSHAKASYIRYKNVFANLNHFLKLRCESMRLSQLTPKLFEEYKIWRRTVPLNKGIIAKSNTVNMELKTIRTLMSYAVKWGYLRTNPTRGVSKLRVNDSKMPRFLSKPEIKLLLDNCGEKLYPIFFLFISTGMRLGELKFLTWGDVEIEQKRIKIQAKENWQPKTGERVIPMSDSIQRLFINLMKKREGNSDYVFVGKNNGPLTIKLRERLKTITKRCGFPEVTKIHTLRHTFASHMIMQNVDLPTLQKLLGHSDIKTTMIYTHLATDHLAEAMNKLSFLDE